jgi:hypothetical protein
VTVKTAAAGATLAPLSESAKSEDLIKDPHPEGGPSEPSEPPTPAFPAVVTSLTVPPPPTEELALEHHTLFNHLATSFIPSNQPCTSGSSDSHIIIPEGSQSPRKRSDLAHAEPVVALVCPFEGGDAYISQAVHDVAGHLSADVVRLDLALGVGFDGPHAPLSETGE